MVVVTACEASSTVCAEARVLGRRAGHLAERRGDDIASLRHGGDIQVISVDRKKKELVGNFKNAGREWRPEGRPEPVNVHDCIDPKLARAVPYGVYDITNNLGWVSVGSNS